MNPVWHFLNGLPQVGPLRVLTDVVKVVAGGGTDLATVGGVLTVNTTQAGTTSVTTEEDLWSYSLPANTLNANNRGVRIKAWGTTAANGNTKTLRLYFGAGTTTLFSSAPNNLTWSVEALYIRTGASAEEFYREVLLGTGPNSATAAHAADTTAAITIRITGQNGTASANDLVFRGATVELLN